MSKLKRSLATMGIAAAGAIGYKTGEYIGVQMTERLLLPGDYLIGTMRNAAKFVFTAVGAVVPIAVYQTRDTLDRAQEEAVPDSTTSAPRTLSILADYRDGLDI